MLLYYITDRSQFAGDERTRRHALLQKIAAAACAGVDVIQLREKDLSTHDLQELTIAALRTIRERSAPATGNRPVATALLINSRTDVALACGANGVHLRADDISASEAHSIWSLSGNSTPPLISVSCHSPADTARAAIEGADLAVFAPVFEKRNSPSDPAGLDALREACRQKTRVLALGGITLQNAPGCIEAGAAGIAGIRLFQQNDISDIVRRLRETTRSTSSLS